MPSPTVHSPSADLTWPTGVSTAAGQLVTKTYTVTVGDGQLNLKLQDLGGTDPNVVIEDLEISPGGPPPPDTDGPRVSSATPSGSVAAVKPTESRVAEFKHPILVHRSRG